MELILPSGQSVLVGTTIKLPSSYYQQSYGYYFRDSDPITTLLTFAAFPVGVFSMAALAADPTPLKDSKIFLEREKPKVPDHAFDDGRYLGISNSFSLLLDTLNSSSRIGTVPANEYETHHVQHVGEYLPQTLDDWYDLSGSTTKGLPLFPSYTYRQDLPSIYANPHSIMKAANSYELAGWSLGIPAVKVLTVLQDIDNYVHGFGGYGGVVPYYGWYSYARVNEFSYEYSMNRLEVSYDMTWHYDSNLGTVVSNPLWGWTHSNRITIFPYSAGPNSVATIAGTQSSLDYPMGIGDVRVIHSPFILRCILDSTVTAIYQSGSPYPHYTPAVGQHDQFTIDRYDFKAFSFPSTSSPSPIPLVLERIRRESTWYGFQAKLDEYLSDIRASAYFSTSDALDSLNISVQTNLLEPIAEIRDLLKIFPDLPRVFRLIRNARRGNLVTTAGDLLKLGSSEYLRFIFGTAPTLSVIGTDLPRLVEVLDVLSKLDPSDHLVAYGTFSHQIPKDILGFDAELVSKSKVVLANYPSDPLRSILQLNSLGILPKGSNLWDLVPMSFVLDWFLNVGGLMSVIENSSVLSLMSINYIVHSYTVKHMLTDEEVEDMGLTRFSAESHHRLFRREVSRVLPPLRASRFDYLVPTRQPPWLTALALVLS